jgi:hypothetical protein
VSLITAAANVITGLGSFSQQFIGHNGPQLRGGEYAAATGTNWASVLTVPVTLGAGKLPRAVFNSMGDMAKWNMNTPANAAKATKAAQALDFLLATISIVEILELTTGFGPPDEGDELKAGSQQFTTVSAQLQSALPGKSWQGDASQSYADLNATLQTISQKMAELDLKLAALVKDQADWITHTRLAFGILKDILLVAYVISLAMIGAPPPLGPVASRIFSLGVSLLAIFAALGLLGASIGLSCRVGQDVDKLTTQYNEQKVAAEKAQKVTPPTPPKVAAAVESRVSSVEAISNSMSGMSARAGAPKSEGEPSASGDKRAPLSALTSEGETSRDGTPEVPETPHETTPSTPAFTDASERLLDAADDRDSQGLAMVAQLRVTCGSLGPKSRSGEVVRALQKTSPEFKELWNKTMAEIQQLPQMAQQGQGAAPAQEAALAGPVPAEAALAGAGTQTDRRETDSRATEQSQR